MLRLSSVLRLSGVLRWSGWLRLSGWLSGARWPHPRHADAPPGPLHIASQLRDLGRPADLSDPVRYQFPRKMGLHRDPPRCGRLTRPVTIDDRRKVR